MNERTRPDSPKVVPPARESVRERMLATLPVTDRRVDAAGIPTAVLESGDGPPVMLLHGPGEFAATWARVIPDLAGTCRVIAPDLPGQGASGTEAAPLTVERVEAWLEELVARTCPSPPVIVGHLLGGAIALRFALGHAHRVDRLVLVDTFGLGPFRPSPGFALALVGFLARPTDRSRDRLFRRCFLDLDRVRRDMDGQMELLEAYALERARVPSVKRALRALMSGFAMRALPPDDLARIAVPVALIWGREDPQVKLGVASAASARYGWPLHVIEGAGDDPAIEQPAAFLDALHAALEDLRTTGGPMPLTR